MSNKAFVVGEIKKLIKNYFDQHHTEETKYKIPLISRLYNEEEIAEVVDSLLSPHKLTLNSPGGLKIEKFERQFADYLQTKNGIMVNSGSSANLVAFLVLTNLTLKNRLKPGDEVIVPAVNWNTSVTPLYALGLKPVFVDVNLHNYGMNIDQVKAAISPQTKAILVVHLLGFPVDMDAIMRVAREYNLYVVEDTCESPGAEWRGKKVGSFGDISTVSFYLSHHITTLEGGMVLTNNDELAELARIIRSQGVMRNVENEAYKNELNAKYAHIDPRFLFANVGYNFRPSEMEGAFGVVQFGKFDHYLRARTQNADFFSSHLAQFSHYLDLPAPSERATYSWFFYPIMLKDNAGFTIRDITSFLESKSIETRPIMSGDFTQHPIADLYEHRVVGNLENAKRIHNNGFIIGVHAGIGEKGRKYIASCFEDFFSKR